MNKALVIFSLLLLPLISFAQPAKVAVCAACHGMKGDAPIAPDYPKLAGQNAAYIEASLKAYKNGDRKGALAGVMAMHAISLSEAEIKELADYYAAQ